MPQMSPILWLKLYAVFSVTLIFFVAVCFFYKIPASTPDSVKPQIKPKLYWKW